MLILIKTLLPLISSFILGMFKASMQAKQQQTELLIQQLTAAEKSRSRAMTIQDSKVSWTRRTLALIFSLTFVALVLILTVAGVFNPDLVINVPQEMFKHSLFSFIGLVKPTVINGYVQLKGLTLALPLIEVLIFICEAVIGFYFGGKK